MSAAWKKWRELSGVLCDQRMVRPVMIYGAEAWTLRRSEEGLLLLLLLFTHCK